MTYDKTKTDPTDTLASTKDMVAITFSPILGLRENIPTNTEYAEVAMNDVVHFRIASAILEKDDKQVEAMISQKQITPDTWLDIQGDFQDISKRLMAYAEMCKTAEIRLLSGLSRLAEKSSEGDVQ